MARSEGGCASPRAVKRRKDFQFRPEGPRHPSPGRSEALGSADPVKRRRKVALIRVGVRPLPLVEVEGEGYTGVVEGPKHPIDPYPLDDLPPNDPRGVDITLIDRMLALTPRQRLDAFLRHMALLQKLRHAKPAS